MLQKEQSLTFGEQGRAAEMQQESGTGRWGGKKTSKAYLQSSFTTHLFSSAAQKGAGLVAVLQRWR